MTHGDAPILQMLILPLISIIALILAYILDCLLGDPYRLHPIIGFGNLIAWGEQRFNKGENRYLKGLLYNGFLIILVGAITFVIELFLPILCNRFLGQGAALASILIFRTFVIFYMLSGTTLIREVREVFKALERSLEDGRKQVARIVGRDTQNLSPHEVQTAALETLSENLSDGVIAPLFWYMLFGLPAMVMYKMINTQDSMVGYKTDRYKDYGRFSALTDDLVNYLPARLTAGLMLLVSGRLDLWHFIRKYGRQHASPNSGYPEAALAGILNCRFGGPHDYFGKEVYKPYIGEHERDLSLQDAEQAIRINRRSEWLMLGLSILVSNIASLIILL